MGARTSAIDRIRKLCLSLPGATEKIAWGAPTFRVHDRVFAMFTENHHGDGRVALWCRAGPGVQEALVESDPENFFVPPYVGPSGWIGVRLDRGLDWSVVKRVAEDAHADVPEKPVRKSRAGRNKKS